MTERRIAVAYSGGRDSTALLHATLAEAQGQGVQVFALHIHHGLSVNADAWLAHCQAQCRRWERVGKPVTFSARRLAASPASGESIEAWAREARYEALAEMAEAHGASVVLLGHHQRDQAETFILQALRGAGLAGLSSMPREATRGGVLWSRPWLDRPREQIEAYVRRHRLRHVEDDSNADPRFARNRLRLQVWPALTAAFAQADGSLATAAGWAQQAWVLGEEVANDDLQGMTRDDALLVAPWSQLSPARRSNALRAWLRSRTGAMPSMSLTARLMAEVTPRASARWAVASGELRLHRGLLRWGPAVAHALVVTAPERSLEIRARGSHALPGWGGALEVVEASEGVPLAWLAQLELRPRSGGEKFQAGLGRPPRSLKKQYQEANVPAWDRNGPLLYSGGQLVYVPGLGLDARILGLPGQRLVTLEWRPRARR